MILSAGLTPAWQQILVFDRFQHGDVNRAREAHWVASGKVLNSGVAVHRLGAPGLTLATVGGPAMQQIEQEFAALGIPRRWVVTQSATRVCTTLFERGTGTLTELIENGRPLLPEELDAFRRAYAEEAARAKVAILIGSLPAGTHDSYYRDLVRCTPCPAVLDFRGEGLLNVLDREPLVVKPNREELAQTMGRPLANDDDLREAMHALNRRGAAWVIVTQGKGPLWVTHEQRAWRAHPLPVDRVVNPLGCGDSLAASIAWSIHAGQGILDGVRLGIAAATANLAQLFPCRFDPTGLHARAREVRVEEV